MVAVALGAVRPSLDRADRRTPPTRPPAPAPASGLRIAYVVNPTPGDPASYAELHLPAPSTTRVALEHGWHVIRLERSGSGVVLWVSVPRRGQEAARFMAYVASDGVVRELHNLDPVSLPIGPNGDVWVTARPRDPGAPDSTTRHGVDLVLPESDVVIGSQQGIPADHMLAVVNEGSVVVQDDIKHARVWPLAGPAEPGPTIDVRGTPWFLKGVASDGRLLVRAPTQLHLFDASGSEAWAWDRPANLHWGGATAFFSPDGAYVVTEFDRLYSEEGYLALDAESGRPLGDLVAGRPIAWETPDTLVAALAGHLERCQVRTGSCDPLGMPDSPTLVVAGAIGLYGSVQVGPAAPA
jgi:hypothetical protein